MDIEKICRCCLALSGPLLSIYDGGSAGDGCVADMLKEIAKLKPQPNDNMPEKACLQCISEINRCFMFKIKCENSNRTLRQLLPEAVKEHIDVQRENVTLSSIAVQTEDKIMISTLVQTMEQKPLLINSNVQTMKKEKHLVQHKEVQTEYEIDIQTTITSEKRLEKYIKESVSEDIIIYEKIESPTGKRKKSLQISPTTTKHLSPSMKKLCFEDNIQTEITAAVEETIQQEEAFIFLEDSNMDSNCSEEHELYIQSSDQKQQEHELERPNSSLDYYEKDELAEEIPEGEQQSTFYPDDEFIYTDNLQTDDDLRMDSSEIIQTSLQESITSLKKKKSPLNKRKDPFKCSQCIMTFVSLKVLRRHLANRHNIKEIELFVEDLVDERQSSEEIEEPTSTNTDYILHKSEMEISVDNVPNPQLCPRERVTSSVKEDTLTQIKYFCDYCQAGFAQRKTFNYHKKHNICMINNFKCNKCERIFISQASLDDHIASYNHEHTCLECNNIFKTIDELSQHMIKEHNRNARNQCHVCKKVFTMKTSLMDHLRIHSGEKPFLCTVCGKSFRQNSNLRQHVLRHNNAKNFKCDTCPDAFITKAELVSHHRTHTGDHPFKCDNCSARFTTSCSLRKHKRKHTGERPYACEFCPLRFAALNVLKNHRRTHTGEKPFKCDYCEKSFTQKGDCLMHQRTHNNKDFKCQCGSKFTKKSNFKHHIKTQHPCLTENEIAALIDGANNNKIAAELHITLKDDEVDLDVDIAGDEDQISEYDNIDDNNDQRDGEVTESLNNAKTPSINSEEIMHIVLEDVI